MNRPLATFLLAAYFLGDSAYSMEGVFDREAEVQQYLTIVSTKTTTEVARTAKEIYSSGISDQRLAKAMNDRLQRSYDVLAPPKGAPQLPESAHFMGHVASDDFGIWMYRALASFGMDEYVPVFKKATLSSKQGGVKSDRVRIAANSELDRIAWHKRKNEIMASRQFYQPGDDQRASQMMNLLVADDLTYRNFALDQIKVEKIQDPRIYKLLEEQISRHIENRDSTPGRQENDLIAQNIKLLGLSGDRRYRAVLERVLTSHAASDVKKYAEVALNQLM